MGVSLATVSGSHSELDFNVIMSYHVLVENIAITALVGAVIWRVYSLASVNTTLLHTLL